MSKRIKNSMKAICIVWVSLLFSVFITSECQAASKYQGNYDRCISDMARVTDPSIEAVQQACRWAAGGTNNGCALWIGSATSAAVPEITAFSETGTVPAMYWGICTDHSDPTREINVKDDNDAFDDHKNLNRTYLPAGPTPVGTTLDIAAFIAGASKEQVSECEARYTRTVDVWRTNGNSGHTDHMYQTVTLRVVDKEACNNEGGSCDDWMPSSYPASNMYHGVTTVDIRIQNERFGGWQNNDIWAMPTDKIDWIACYYPGVQRTSDTDTGSLNGFDLTYPDTYGYRGVSLPRDRCIALVGPVEYEPLYIKVNRVSEWQNKLIMTGDADEEFEGTWTRGDDTVRYNIVSKQTHEGDAGSTFTETATTGTPVEADIDTHNPSTDYRACTCKNFSCNEAGWHDTSHYEGTPPYQTLVQSGYRDSSEEYCADKEYTYNQCSCCDCDWGNRGCYSGPIYNTGHKNTYERSLNDATVVFGPVSDSLSVRLPYNFTTSTDLSIDRSLVYSGSPNAIRVSSVTASVHTRYNGVTIADYATQVPGAAIFLYAYVTSDGGGGGFGGSLGGTNNICEITDTKQCVELESTGQTLNAGGSLGGSTDTIWSGLTYNAFDAAAGDYMCFASSVSPYTVAGDTDMAGGDGVWTYSSPKCAIIAKRPIFQVWGGSMYSVGNIVATYNNKVNIFY